MLDLRYYSMICMDAYKCLENTHQNIQYYNIRLKPTLQYQPFQFLWLLTFSFFSQLLSVSFKNIAQNHPYDKFRSKIQFYKQILLMKANSKRGWTKEQDDELFAQVAGQHPQKMKWVQVAKVLQNSYGRLRTGKQCRQRWQHQLNPTIMRNQWSVEEQNCLFRKQKQIGNKWALISQFLPGRTDNAVKNYFYSFVRRILTKINVYVSKQKERNEFRNIRDFQNEFLSKLMAIVDGNFNKRMRLTGRDIDSLSKEILNRVISLGHQSFIDIDSCERQESMDDLIMKMHQFRRNCKKRKQKRKDEEDERLNRQKSNSDSNFISEEHQNQIMTSSMNRAKSNVNLQLKRDVDVGGQVEQQNQSNIHSNQNEKNRERKDKLQLQQSSRHISSNKQTIDGNEERQIVRDRDNIEGWNTSNKIQVSLFASYEKILLEPSQLKNQGIFQQFPDLSYLGQEQYWEFKEESEPFALFRQREERPDHNRSFEEIQAVTKQQMLEASLALEECLRCFQKQGNNSIQNFSQSDKP